MVSADGATGTDKFPVLPREWLRFCLGRIYDNTDYTAAPRRIILNRYGRGTMTKREFTAIILKLTGVYILVRYLGFLPMVLSPLTVIRFGQAESVTTWFWGLAAIIPPLVYLAACILIVVKSEIIATKLIPDDGDFSVGFSLSKEDVLTVAFCCIGLTVLVSAIPTVVQSVSNLALARKAPEQWDPSRYWINACARLAANVVQTVIGLALFLQARGLAGLWHKLRDNKGI